MRALFLFVFLMMSFLVFAEREENIPREEEVAPEENSRSIEEAQEETDDLLLENDELRAEVDRLQAECNCSGNANENENQQREEYVTQREEAPVVIINQLPPQEVQREEAPPATPAEVPQFNNSQYQNNYQFTKPGPEAPPVEIFYKAPEN